MVRKLLNRSGPGFSDTIWLVNIVGDGTHTFAYDDRERLVDVDLGAVVYQHNALGQRIVKNNGTSTLFSYGESGEIIGEYGATGTPIQETVYFNGAPVSVLQGSNVYEVHTDHLGTPRAISDAGTVIWRWESDPFGATAANEDPDGNGIGFTYNLRFPGQYYDQETGLHYNYFRTLDPSTGRYLESDPIGLRGGLNTYGYVGGNPLSRTDPLGLVDPATAAATAEVAIYCTGPQAAVCAGTAAVAAVGLTSAYAGTKFYDAFASQIGAGIDAVANACATESDEAREKRCNENLERDLETCAALGNRDGQSAYAICAKQAYLRYGNCLAGRDDLIDAPLPPFGTK